MLETQVFGHNERNWENYEVVSDSYMLKCFVKFWIRFLGLKNILKLKNKFYFTHFIYNFVLPVPFKWNLKINLTIKWITFSFSA